MVALDICSEHDGTSGNELIWKDDVRPAERRQRMVENGMVIIIVFYYSAYGR